MLLDNRMHIDQDLDEVFAPKEPMKNQKCRDGDDQVG